MMAVPTELVNEIRAPHRPEAERLTGLTTGTRCVPAQPVVRAGRAGVRRATTTYTGSRPGRRQPEHRPGRTASPGGTPATHTDPAKSPATGSHTRSVLKAQLPGGTPAGRRPAPPRSRSGASNSPPPQAPPAPDHPRQRQRPPVSPHAGATSDPHGEADFPGRRHLPGGRPVEQGCGPGWTPGRRPPSGSGRAAPRCGPEQRPAAGPPPSRCFPVPGISSSRWSARGFPRHRLRRRLVSRCRAPPAPSGPRTASRHLVSPATARSSACRVRKMPTPPVTMNSRASPAARLAAWMPKLGRPDGRGHLRRVGRACRPGPRCRSGERGG